MKFTQDEIDRCLEGVTIEKVPLRNVELKKKLLFPFQSSDDETISKSLCSKEGMKRAMVSVSRVFG